MAPRKNAKTADAAATLSVVEGGKKGKKESVTIIKLTIASTDPMLQHAMTPWAMDHLPGGTKSMEKPNTDDMDAREQADLVRYRGPKDELGVPAKCLFSALREAGKQIKIGPMQKITNAKQSVLPALIRFNCEGGSMRGFLPFKDQSPDSWEPDTDSTRNPTTGGRTTTIRPLFPSWEIELEFEFTPFANVGLAKIRELVDIAGKAHGLGANRMNNPYGRFAVTRWETKEKSVPTAKAA